MPRAACRATKAQQKAGWAGQNPRARLAQLVKSVPCADTDERCAEWAENGECDNNETYMAKSCSRSCGWCD